MKLETGPSPVSEKIINEMAMAAIIHYIANELSMAEMHIYAVALNSQPYKFDDTRVDYIMDYLTVDIMSIVGQSIEDYNFLIKNGGLTTNCLYEYNIARKPQVIRAWQSYGLPDPNSCGIRSWMVLGKQQQFIFPDDDDDNPIPTGKKRLLVVGVPIDL